MFHPTATLISRTISRHAVSKKFSLPCKCTDVVMTSTSTLQNHTLNCQYFVSTELGPQVQTQNMNCDGATGTATAPAKSSVARSKNSGIHRSIKTKTCCWIIFTDDKIGKKMLAEHKAKHCLLPLSIRYQGPGGKPDHIHSSSLTRVPCADTWPFAFQRPSSTRCNDRGPSVYSFCPVPAISRAPQLSRSGNM